jgi:hypothetical protein
VILSRRLLGRVVSYLIVIVAAAVACWRAARADAKPEVISSELAFDRKAYSDVTSREVSERRQAALHYPGSNWSQQDDFHEQERTAITDYAESHEVNLSTVTRALDQGMREAWRTPGDAAISQRIVPCRPRLNY